MAEPSLLEQLEARQEESEEETPKPPEVEATSLLDQLIARHEELAPIGAPEPAYRIEAILASKEFNNLNRDLNIRGLALAMASARDLELRIHRDKANSRINAGEAPFTFNDVLKRRERSSGISIDEYKKALSFQGFRPDYLMREIGVKGRPVNEVLQTLEDERAKYTLTPHERKVAVRGSLINRGGVARLKAQGKPVPERLLEPRRFNYKIISPDEGGPEAEAVVVQEGTEAYQDATNLFAAYFDEDTKRGGVYAAALEDANGNMLNEEGLRVFQENIATYETNQWLEKQLDAGRTELSKAHAEYTAELSRQMRHALKVAALAHTVGRWHSPAWLSWERVTSIEKPDESDHSWIRKAWSRGSRVRLELVGMDRDGVPVYRTTSPVWHIFEMSDMFQSAGVGAVDRVAEWAKESGEDTGTLLEAMSEGALEGIEDRRHLLEYSMSTKWAKTSTAGAWVMGSIGFVGLLATPDLFVGAAGLAKIVKKISQGTSRWTKSGRILRKTIDEMAEGAIAESKAAEAMSRARQAADNDDWDLVEREMLEAVDHMRRGEEAERYIRTEAQFAADTVDMGEEMIYLRQRRNVPDIAPKDGNALADQIPGAFGHRSENLHPSVRRAQFRGELEHQLGSYRDFYNQSESIERLVDSIRMIRRGEADWAGELSRRVVGPHRDGLVQWLASRGLSRVELEDSPEKLKRVVKFLDYLQDYEATRTLIHDPIAWVDGLRDLAYRLPLSEESLFKFLGDMDLSVPNRTRGKLDGIMDAVKRSSDAFAELKKAAVPDQAAMFKAIGRAISAVEANIETRAASMAIVRDLVAAAKGLKAAPIMAKAANKFAEVRELSPTALLYRDQIQAAFKMTDDEATAAARFLDMLAENWGNRTGRDPVEYFAETFAPEAFKDKAAFMRRLFKPPPLYVAEDVAAASLPAGYRIEKEGDAWRVLDEADEVLGSSLDPLDAAAAAIDKLIGLGVMTRHELDLSATRVGPMLLGQPMSVVIQVIRKLPHEHFMAHTDDGVHLVRHTDGQTSSVGYGIDGVNRLMKADNVTSIHNHPNNSIFSGTDISSAAVVDERRGIVTNPDGSYWVLDTPDGFGDYSKAVLREKYGSLANVPADKELDRMAFSFEIRAASAASMVDAHRRIAEEIAGGRQLSRKEATELISKFFSEAFGGAPDADGVYRSGRLSGVLQKRGINHILTRVGPEDAVTRTGQGLEPTFGERARRAATEEGLDILFSRATQDVPKAARAVEANLKEGVLARDKTGRVIAQESPEFVDIEKVTRGPRFRRTEEGTLRNQRELSALADLIDPPGGVSLLKKLRVAWNNVPPETRKVLSEFEGDYFMSRIADVIPLMERNLERLQNSLRGRLQESGALEPDFFVLAAMFKDNVRHAESALRRHLKKLPEPNRAEVSRLVDLLKDEAHRVSEQITRDLRHISRVSPSARELLQISTSKVYKGPDFGWSQVSDAAKKLSRELVEAETPELQKAVHWLNRMETEWVDDVPFHQQKAFGDWNVVDLSNPVQQGSTDLAWGALGLKFDDAFETRVVTKQDVIDQLNGLPWFHGTKKQISLLDYSLKYSGSSYGNMLGPGLYLTASPETAVRYTNRLYGAHRGTLKTVDVRIRDLLDITGTADDVLRQIKGLKRGDTDLTDLVGRLYKESRIGGAHMSEGSGQLLWMRVSDEMNRQPARAKRLQEELIDSGIDGVYHYGRQDGAVLVLFDPNANSLSGAVSTLLRESDIRPERFLYQKIARQTEWEMKELGEGLVELTSAEIRAGRAAGEAPAVAAVKPGVSEAQRVMRESVSAEKAIEWGIEFGPDMWSGARTGEPIIVFGYRGSGRVERVAAYAEGVEGPVFGEAFYIAANEKVAAKFGDVAPITVTLNKPYVIHSDADMVRLFGDRPIPYDNASRIPLLEEATRKLKADGYDGVIVNITSFADNAVDGSGASIKRVREIFGDSQVVAFKGADATTRAAEEVMGGGLVFKVDGDVLRVQSIEIPEVLRGKGIGQELYLRAMEHAKSIGKGFASDLAPSPAAIAAYERMIEKGAPLTRKMVEAADGKMVQQFVASADDLRRLDADAVRRGAEDVPPRILKQDIDDELRGATEFLSDGRVIIYGLNKPSFATFIHEIGHVMRRDLDEKQMETIGKWLRETEGVDVGVKGARFEGSAESVIQAEEKFARAFETYIHTGEAPQPALKKIFDQMKEWLVAFYGRIIGLDVTVTPEVRKVFDEMVSQSPPKRPLLKGMAKMLKDELMGPSLKGTLKINVLGEIAREARKLGHDVSVESLTKQLDETAAADATARGVKKKEGIGHILLPGPVYMAGRFPEGREKFTANELMDVLANMHMRKRMISGPGPRVALKKRAEAIQEMTPTEIIDNWVKSGKNDGVVAWTRNVMIGGDAFEDLRYMPKEVRDAALAVPRRIEQTVGDSIHIVGEGDIETVTKYLTGEQVFFKDSGRAAISSGHDMMGSVVLQLRRFFGPQGPLTTAERDALVDFIESIHVHKTSAEFIQSTAKKELVVEAFSKLTSRSGSHPFITEVLQAAGVKPGAKLTPEVFGTSAKPGRPSSIIEALTYAAGITRRAPEGAGRVVSFDDLKYLEAAQEMNTAKIFNQLYKDMRTPSLFGSDPRVANRIVVLIAAYGTAAKAMNRWLELGIAVDPKSATAFKKWIVGEALDSEADMARVLQLYQVHGFSPNFVEGLGMFGMNMYVPSKVRKRLSNALARATDPEMSASLKGDFLEAIGSGTAVTKSKTWMNFAWLYRYLKTRMVRGNFILKTRYFTMNTFDHFNQMALVTGFRPAFISTTRMVTQNALSNPLGQAIIVAAGRVGLEGAAEAVRRVLSAAGDKGAHFASRILMGSKWRLDLNMVLEGKGMFRLGGNVYSGKQIRDIALETGIFSSFDTSQLGMKIQKSIDLFLENAKKNDPGLYRKFKRFMSPDPRDLYHVSQDIAEGWSERERLGAMLTMMELGMDPRTAARVTIDALYDYAGSMSKWDRSFIINMFLPFWAFQKNANRQLIDTIFSPWGAYRLGVMRRAWDHGTELISDMMYFDMVDEYGINTENLPTNLRDAYYGVKTALVDHYETPDAIPDEVHRDIALWVAGMITTQTLVDNQLYTGTELQNKLMQMGNARIAGFYVPQPKMEHRKGFRRIRPGIAIPHEYTVNMKKFIDGIRVADPATPYTFVMLPEPVYHAAFHHMGYLVASMILLGHEIVDLPMSMIEEDDGTDILAHPFTPLKEVFSPQRAPLISEILAEFGMDDAAYPTRLHPSLVGVAEAHGIDVFPTTPLEDPYASEEERKAALEESRAVLGSVGILKEKRYYMQPGLARLFFVNNPIGEYNRLIVGWENTPLEESAKQGEAIRWARGVFGLDVEEVWPKRTVQYELRRAREEIGSKKVYEKARKGRPKKTGER